MIYRVHLGRCSNGAHKTLKQRLTACRDFVAGCHRRRIRKTCGSMPFLKEHKRSSGRAEGICVMFPRRCWLPRSRLTASRQPAPDIFLRQKVFPPAPRPTTLLTLGIVIRIWKASLVTRREHTCDRTCTATCSRPLSRRSVVTFRDSEISRSFCFLNTATPAEIERRHLSPTDSGCSAMADPRRPWSAILPRMATTSSTRTRDSAEVSHYGKPHAFRRSRTTISSKETGPSNLRKLAMPFRLGSQSRSGKRCLHSSAHSAPPRESPLRRRNLAAYLSRFEPAL